MVRKTRLWIIGSEGEQEGIILFSGRGIPNRIGGYNHHKIYVSWLFYSIVTAYYLLFVPL